MADEEAVIGDGPATVAAQSHARLTDTVSAVLSGPDRTPLRGPDPAEWPEEQFVPPPDIAAQGDGSYEIKGPDPDKWPAEQVGAVTPIPGEVTVDGTGNVTVGDSGQISSSGTVLGTVDPPE